MRRLVLAAAAHTDLQEIGRFTETRWGVGQKQRYLSAIDTALRRLQYNPGRGRPRAEVRPGYHSLLVGRHVIFYRFNDDECEILRIMHDAKDVHRLFGDSQ